MKAAACGVLLCLLLPGASYAHQPRIAFGARHPYTDPVIVEKPEVSAAYYGILDGAPDYYRIDSATPYRLYLNILVPDRRDSVLDINADVMSDNKTLLRLKGAGYAWQRFFEPIARDRYLKGPELDWRLRQGTYYIKVYNRRNTGKYVLAVGSTESFPVSEVVKMAFTLPAIKKGFFGRSGYCAFFSPAGLIIAGYALVFAGLVWGAVFAMRRFAFR